MKRIASGTQVASMPTHPADSGTPGQFADASTTPSATPTQLTPKWCNSVQEAIIRPIEDAGEVLSDDMDQFKNVVAGVHGIKAHATDTGTVSTPKTRAVVAVVGSRATGVGSGCFAGGSGVASGQGAAVLGGESVNASGQNATCVGGGSNAASALDTTCVGGTSAVASAAQAATLGGDNPTASGLKSVAIGGHDLTASGENAAAIGGDTNVAAAAESFCGGGNSHDIQSGSTRAAVVGGNNHTITAARAIALGGDSHTLAGADSAGLAGANNIVSAAKGFVIGGTGNDVQSGAAQSGIIASDTCTVTSDSSKPNKVLIASLGATLANDNDPASSGADGYCLAGGHTNDPVSGGATNVDVTWLLSSKHGTLELDNATVLAGADYAEYFPNATEEVIPPGSLVARQGKTVRLARPGDRVLGVVSAAPSVVGNAAGLSWSGAKLRDEWGALVYEEREVCRFEITEVQQIEHCRFKVVEAGPKGKKVVKHRFKGPVSKCPIDIPASAERYLVATPVVVYRYHGPVSKCPVEIPADAKRWISRDPVRNPDYDPSRPYVARRHRPDQWTAVALLGQVRVRIGKGVEEGDYLTPGADGCALGTLARPDGRPVEVMEITTPFDAARGYGVALCLVG